jgi:hypothetical protein
MIAAETLEALAVRFEERAVVLDQYASQSDYASREQALLESGAADGLKEAAGMLRETIASLAAI